MQAGVTNPLSETFRIYNPDKNVQDRDPDLRFINHWVAELRGYSLPEIMNEVYVGESLYPAPILNWTQTRKLNGKTVFDRRKRVKERLLAEERAEYEQAVAAKRTVDKYWKNKNKQFQEYKYK